MLQHNNILFPSDNHYGIPLLDRGRQAAALYAPVMRWGTVARTTRLHGGTWHFFTDDYKFKRLWENPERLLSTQCAAVVEPNYSLADDTPFAFAIWATYQKRWLARYWQHGGVQILVDLSVPEQFADLNLLGVPDGWQAFAFRATKQQGEEPVASALTAASRVAHGMPACFLVYGGGEAVRAWCQGKGVLWLPEDMTAKPWRKERGN